MIGNSCGVNLGPVAPRPEAWALLGRLSKAIESLEDGISVTEARFDGVLEKRPEAKGPCGTELDSSNAEIAQQLANFSRRVEEAVNRLGDIRNRSVV